MRECWYGREEIKGCEGGGCKSGKGWKWVRDERVRGGMRGERWVMKGHWYGMGEIRVAREGRQRQTDRQARGHGRNRQADKQTYEKKDRKTNTHGRKEIKKEGMNKRKNK